jgi:hypothetical protein
MFQFVGNKSNQILARNTHEGVRKAQVVIVSIFIVRLLYIGLTLYRNNIISILSQHFAFDRF